MKIKSKNTENQSPNQINKIQARNHKRNFGKDLKQLQSDNLLGKKAQCLKKSRNKKVEENPVSEYENDILNRILHLEAHQQGFKINHNYIKVHNLLNNKMRVFLVKYLYKLYIKLRLKRTTLYLAVFYMDNYFQKTKIYSQSDLIIICQASMHIAMKYEEIYPPELSDWAGVKNKNAIYAAQSEILKQLDFKLAHFTVQHFRQYYLYKKNMGDTLKQQYTKLIADSLLLDVNFYQFKASEIAKNIISVVSGTRKNKKASNDDNISILQEPTLKIKQHLSKIDNFEWVFKNVSLLIVANTIEQVLKQIISNIDTILLKSTNDKIR